MFRICLFYILLIRFQFSNCVERKIMKNSYYETSKNYNNDETDGKIVKKHAFTFELQKDRKLDDMQSTALPRHLKNLNMPFLVPLKYLAMKKPKGFWAKSENTMVRLKLPTSRETYSSIMLRNTDSESKGTISTKIQNPTKTSKAPQEESNEAATNFELDLRIPTRIIVFSKTRPSHLSSDIQARFGKSLMKQELREFVKNVPKQLLFEILQDQLQKGSKVSQLFGNRKESQKDAKRNKLTDDKFKSEYRKKQRNYLNKLESEQFMSMSSLRPTKQNYKKNAEDLVNQITTESEIQTFQSRFDEIERETIAAYGETTDDYIHIETIDQTFIEENSSIQEGTTTSVIDDYVTGKTEFLTTDTILRKHPEKYRYILPNQWSPNKFYFISPVMKKKRKKTMTYKLAKTKSKEKSSIKYNTRRLKFRTKIMPSIRFFSKYNNKVIAKDTYDEDDFNTSLIQQFCKENKMKPKDRPRYYAPRRKQISIDDKIYNASKNKTFNTYKVHKEYPTKREFFYDDTLEGKEGTYKNKDIYTSKRKPISYQVNLHHTENDIFIPTVKHFSKQKGIKNFSDNSGVELSEQIKTKIFLENVIIKIENNTRNYASIYQSWSESLKRSWAENEYTRGRTGDPYIYLDLYDDYYNYQFVNKLNMLDPWTPPLNLTARALLRHKLPDIAVEVQAPSGLRHVEVQYHGMFQDYLMERLKQFSTWSMIVPFNPYKFTLNTVPFYGTTKILALFSLATYRPIPYLMSTESVILRNDYLVLTQPYELKITRSDEIYEEQVKDEGENQDTDTQNEDTATRKRDVLPGGGFLRTKHYVKCYECGLHVNKVPTTADCHDYFESFRKRGSNVHKVKCYWAEWKNGRYFRGCFLRYLDVGVEYEERGCRTWPPMRGNSYASLRFSKLERALKRESDSCIISPQAFLTPFDRGISLFARYHVCVCSTRYCNYGRITEISWISLFLLILCCL